MSRFLRQKQCHAALACAAVLALGGAATASAQSGGSTTGGAAFIPPPPPPAKATIWNGKAIAPAGAPARVKKVIAYGNQIIGKPYRYGGGHRLLASRSRRGRARWGKLDTGYDCSGSVSHALHGGRFLRAPLDSGSFASWGQPGPGQWITVYTNAGHAYLVVAGLRFDTGMRDNPNATGPAWSKKLRRSASYEPRHPRRY
jgi:cell wall-associated NlpC family hydrolase